MEHAFSAPSTRRVPPQGRVNAEYKRYWRIRDESRILLKFSEDCGYLRPSL
jgi:hypothetical protein